ncbi:hypothetical protein HDV00_005476 [Rhizophlyctis rosea]|nr:hypothetical protein HDV00_005476 [Rhizophlyctis rosea]
MTNPRRMRARRIASHQSDDNSQEAVDQYVAQRRTAYSASTSDPNLRMTEDLGEIVSRLPSLNQTAGDPMLLEKEPQSVGGLVTSDVPPIAPTQTPPPQNPTSQSKSKKSRKQQKIANPTSDQTPQQQSVTTRPLPSRRALDLFCLRYAAAALYVAAGRSLMVEELLHEIKAAFAENGGVEALLETFVATDDMDVMTAEDGSVEASGKTAGKMNDVEATVEGPPDGKSKRWNSKILSDDWICPSCRLNNRASRPNCIQCGTASTGQPAVIGGRRGDWTCHQKDCGFVNFESRVRCKQCGKARPGLDGRILHDGEGDVPADESGRKSHPTADAAASLPADTTPSSTNPSKPKQPPKPLRIHLVPPDGLRKLIIRHPQYHTKIQNKIWTVSVTSDTPYIVSITEVKQDGTSAVNGAAVLDVVALDVAMRAKKACEEKRREKREESVRKLMGDAGGDGPPPEMLDEEVLDAWAGQFEKIYNSLLPPKSAATDREYFLAKIQRIIDGAYPGMGIKAYSYGSSINNLGFASSDVDVTLLMEGEGDIRKTEVAKM